MTLTANFIIPKINASTASKAILTIPLKNAKNPPEKFQIANITINFQIVWFAGNFSPLVNTASDAFNANPPDVFNAIWTLSTIKTAFVSCAIKEIRVSAQITEKNSCKIAKLLYRTWLIPITRVISVRVVMLSIFGWVIARSRRI